jgi:Fe-S cluster assembly ATP-binding protein
MSHSLQIQNLYAGVGEKKILQGLNLKINTNEIHVIMGPNGAGKSTLSNCIIGNPKYQILSGDILFDDQNINNLKVDERARLGLFLSFQQPMAIKGVKNCDFVRQAMQACEKKCSLMNFFSQYDTACEELFIPKNFAERYLNIGFSGGEMKKNEILQMKMLKPKFAILDEIDSGLDVDACKVIGKNVSEMINENFGCLIITHQAKILDYIKTDFIHILIDGKIVKTGNVDLVKKIEDQGFEWIKNEVL